MPQGSVTTVSHQFRSQNAKKKAERRARDHNLGVTKAICSGCLQTAIVQCGKAHFGCRGVFGGFKLRPSLNLSFPKRAGNWTDITTLLGESLVNRDKVIEEATIEQSLEKKVA